MSNPNFAISPVICRKTTHVYISIPVIAPPGLEVSSLSNWSAKASNRLANSNSSAQSSIPSILITCCGFLLFAPLLAPLLHMFSQKFPAILFFSHFAPSQALELYWFISVCPK